MTTEKHQICSTITETLRPNTIFPVLIGGYNSKKGSHSSAKLKPVCKSSIGTVRNSQVLFYALSV